MSDYFVTLGKAMAAELSRNPAQRQRFKQIANDAISKHLRGPMARDQATVDPDLEPRGGLNNGSEAPSADECLMFIQTLLAKLPPDQHDQLMSKLSELIQVAHSGDTNGGVNSEALDSSRSGKRSARDNSMPSPLPSLDRGKRPAQDTAFRNSFAQRFPGAGRITVIG